MEQHLLELGQIIQTHELDTCIGRFCAIHRPMPGPWSTWPRYWRDGRGIMERICPCGIGHPVAEMYEHALATGEGGASLIHRCCIHPCAPIDGGSE